MSLHPRITRDIVYGSGRVDVHTLPRERALLLDMYQPADVQPQDARPALIMAFGGAFHRGDRVRDEFEQGGVRNTSVAAYCEAFARQGFVTFSIDYRLVTEDPDPGSTFVIGDPDAVPMSRVAHVRSLMGLPPAEARTVWAGMEAAADDMAAAFRFVQGHATRWGIDAGRIAIGGFSAGARTALGVAYGERVGAAAVVSLSGYMAGPDLARLVRPHHALAPALLIRGEHDLDYIVAQAGSMHEHLVASGVACESWSVPGGSHFYPSDSAAVRQDGHTSTVMGAMASFLEAAL